MEFYKEILISALIDNKVEILFPDLEFNANRIIEIESYKALNKIKEIIEDHDNDDLDCFQKIEEIVCILESFETGMDAKFV